MECEHTPLLRKVLPLSATLGASNECLKSVPWHLRPPPLKAMQLQSRLDEFVLDIVLPPRALRLTHPILELRPAAWTAMLVDILAKHIAYGTILISQILANCGGIHKHLTLEFSGAGMASAGAIG